MSFSSSAPVSPPSSARRRRVRVGLTLGIAEGGGIKAPEARGIARVFVHDAPARKLVLAIGDGTPTPAQEAELRDKARSAALLCAATPTPNCTERPVASQAVPKRTLICAVTFALVVAGCSSSKHASSGTSPTTTTKGAHSPGGSTAGNASPTTATVSATAPLQIATAPWQLPEGRAREVVLAGDHALYVVGGLNPGKSSTARVWHVALPAGTTTRLAILPIAVHDASGAWLPPSVFVFGGGNASEVSAVQQYQAGAAKVAAQLPEARSDTSAITINGTAYVLGGYDGSAEPAAVLATNDGVTFRAVAQLAQTVRYAAAAEVAGRIYLLGGEHHGTTVSTVQTIDPGPGAARIAGQLPMPITEATAVVLDDAILLIGGRSGGRTLDTVQGYDPATGALTVVGHLPYPVADAGAAVVDGVAYVVGGETPAVTASVITLRHG